MSNFTVFPAIDLRSGQVVRLRQGDRNQAEEFDLSPAAAAKKWVEQGSSWLHVVNLDGAFGEDSQPNIKALKSIINAVGRDIKIQFGGGLRDLASIDHVLALGVTRVIIGTAAIKIPDLLHKALSTFGPRKVVLGVDAKDGLTRISGWEENTAVAPADLIKSFLPDGLTTVIFTNIRRDGMQTGVDVAATQSLAMETGTAVIASGGAASLEDIQAVKMAGLAGVIVGKALYEHSFSLSEALQC